MMFLNYCSCGWQFTFLIRWLILQMYLIFSCFLVQKGFLNFCIVLKVKNSGRLSQTCSKFGKHILSKDCRWRSRVGYGVVTVISCIHNGFKPRSMVCWWHQSILKRKLSRSSATEFWNIFSEWKIEIRTVWHFPKSMSQWCLVSSGQFKTFSVHQVLVFIAWSGRGTERI